jgi:hypothetical protein
LTNRSSKRLNYEKISSLNTRLLLTLQNKLALLFNKNSLTQSRQETLINLTLVFQNKLALLFDEKSLTQSEQETLDTLALVLQLAKVLTSNAKISQS